MMDHCTVYQSWPGGGAREVAGKGTVPVCPFDFTTFLSSTLNYTIIGVGIGRGVCALFLQ